jgi:O-antigen ligase
MKLGLRVIMDNPVLGVGVNNFPIVMKQYIRQEFGRAWLYAVHNKYLLVWAEAGIGGLLAFIWFLLATIRRGWDCWNLKDRFLSPLALGFTAAIAGQMVHMFVDVFNSRPQVQLLWLVAGLITAMRSIRW